MKECWKLLVVNKLYGHAEFFVYNGRLKSCKGYLKRGINTLYWLFILAGKKWLFFYDFFTISDVLKVIQY